MKTSEFLSKTIKRLRLMNRNTQEEVAKYLGISRQAYSRYENGQREPSIDTIDALCNFFNVSPVVFFMNDFKKNMKPYKVLSTLSGEYEFELNVLSNYIDEVILNGFDLAEKDSRFQENDLTREARKQFRKVVKNITLLKTDLNMQLDRMNEGFEYYIEYENNIKNGDLLNKELYDHYFKKKYFLLLSDELKEE